MAFDFKKEYKEFYMPKNKPEIVNVPKANYIAVRGKGNPNEEGGAYQQAISVLYAVAYTLKMSYKTDYKIEGFFEYVVPPLEGFWWQDDVESVYIKGNDKPIYASSKRLEEVKQKREKILEQYNLGLQTDASKKTLNDWFDEWMELYVVGKVKPRTVQNYIREYERCKSYIGHIKVNQLQPTYIQKMVNELFKKGYKRATVKQSVSV